jgi:hypothetical protein
MYINAYGCDAVPSEYVVIPKNDPTPRYIDVISGRMYLFLCDDPSAFPYASSLIFSSFAVITGFILISLTVAAVSAGVKRRLQEIQNYNETKKLLALEKQQADEAMEIVEKLKSDSEDHYKSSSYESSSTGTKDQQQDDEGVDDEVEMPSRLRPIIDKSVSLLRALTFMKSSDDSSGAGAGGGGGMKKPKQSNLKKATSSFKGIPLLQNKPLIRQICRQMWNDVDTTRKKRKELREESVKDDSLDGGAGGGEGEGKESQRRGSVMVGGSPTAAAAVVATARRGSIVAPGGGSGRRGSVSTRRKSSLKVVTHAFHLTHQFQSMSILNTNRALPGGGGHPGHGHAPPLSLSQGSSPSASTSTMRLSGRQTSFSHQLLKDYKLEEILSSKENFLLFVRNSLASPVYIAYLISLILTTASCQIFCVNKDNCDNFWPLFLLIQILLTLDILVRIITAYPTYFDYFDSQRNLFDCFIVIIIWIPIFYTKGYGVAIAGSSPTLPPLLLVLIPSLISPSLLLSLHRHRSNRLSPSSLPSPLMDH